MEDEDITFNLTSSWWIKDFPSQSGPIESESYENSYGKFILKSDIDQLQKLQVTIETSNLTTTIPVNITLEIHNFNNESKSEKIEESFNFSPTAATFDIAFKKPSRFYKQSSGYLDQNESMRIDFTIQTKEDNSAPALDYSNMFSNSNFYGTATYTPSYKDNSKELTGYVGLKNQGATCYMNSFLQSLFHLPAFRRLVYNIHTTGNEDSIPLNLQRLFCKMQFSDKACSTKSLTKSFGWGDAEAFTQHDVHEFCRVLLDKIEQKLKGTELENSIADLFKGKFRNYIRCKKVNYESFRDEEYYDLQMLVKGCKDLYASFAAYTEKEILEGDNQYQTDDYGKQDAEMGIEFLEYPKILHIHLRRFDYDFDYCRQYKINDKFEFPEVLNLKAYLAEDLQAQQQIPSTFELFGVLVHMGSVYAGHYYAFLRTTEDPQWYEFNDTSVQKVTKDKAIDDNFGGENETGYKYEKTYSAYILIYVRKDALHEVFAEINEHSIPKHLFDFIEKEKIRKEEKKKLKEEQKNQVKLTIFTNKSIIDTLSRGIIGFDSDKVKKELYLEKTMTYADVISKVKEELSYDKIRLWTCTYSSNPKSIINPNDETTLESSKSSTMTVYAENEFKEDSISDDSIVIWVIFFFPSHLSEALQYIGSFTIKKSEKVSQLYPQINEKIGFPTSTELISYIPTYSSPKSIQNDDTFDELLKNNESLNFLVVQQALNTPLLEPKITFVPDFKDDNEDKDEKPKIERIANLPIFNFNDISNPLELTYTKYVISKSPSIEILIHKFEEPKTPLFYVQFNNITNLNDLKLFITEKLGYKYDPEKDSVEVFKEDDKNPGQPSVSPQTLSNSMCTWVFGSGRDGISNIYIYYHENLPEKELEKTYLFTILLQSDGYNVDRTFRFRVPKNCQVGYLIDELKKSGEIDKEKENRFCEVFNSRIYKTMKSDETLLSPYFPYLLQIIPEDQLVINENEKLIDGTYATKSEYDTFDTFGDPFFIKLLPDEKLDAFKQRLYSHLKVNLEPEKLEKIKFVISEPYSKLEQSKILKDDDVVIEVVKSFNKDVKLFLLEEGVKKQKSYVQSYYTQKEKPVKIYG